jgi:hypothetical protein
MAEERHLPVVAYDLGIVREQNRHDGARLRVLDVDDVARAGNNRALDLALLVTYDLRGALPWLNRPDFPEE